MARTNPAPRRGAGGAVVVSPAASFSAEFDVDPDMAIIIVDTSGGDVPANLPSLLSVETGRQILLVRQGDNDLQLVPDGADEVGANGAGTTYSMVAAGQTTITLTANPADTVWEIAGSQGQAAQSTLQNTIKTLVLGALSAQVGNDRTTQLTVNDGLGQPSTGTHWQFRVQVWDDQTFTTASVNGVATVGATGFAISGDGTNDLVAEVSDVNALLDLTITDATGGADHWITCTPTASYRNTGAIMPILVFVTGAWA